MNISSINGQSMIFIEGIKVKYNDPNTSNVLVVGLTNDNLLDFCNLSWSIGYLTNGGLVVTDSGSLQISGGDYSNWSGDNEYPFEFVCEQIGLQILTEE